MHLHLLTALSLLTTSTLSLPYTQPFADAQSHPNILTARTPSNIPTAATAKSLLSTLIVSPKVKSVNYSRALFPNWAVYNGSCDVREFVLIRDGTNLTISKTSCYPYNGTWVSPYDGVTWKSATNIQIDHLVPLAEAWKSGAQQWNLTKRTQFANDVVNPQLWSVTGAVNQNKSDSDPSQWMPPLKSFQCTYAKSYTKVKAFYNLTVTAAEKVALSNAIAACLS